MSVLMKTLATPSSRAFTEEAMRWVNELFGPLVEVLVPNLSPGTLYQA